MSSTDRHADSFSRTDAAAAATTQVSPQQAPKTADNEAQAAKALAERERTFTTGDDGPEDGAAAPIPEPAPPSRLDAAVTRIRSADRPSPFGSGHFPPLPVPRPRR